ncbi:hypothetical protein CsSME_00001900 [Camellia sinensis var. sinensis]
MASLICAVPRTREALLYSILLSSRFNNNPTPKLKSFSIQLSIVPQPHRHCPCSSSSSSNGGGVVGVSVGKEEGQLLTSPQLVALEYSDLNLSHNFSQVYINYIHIDFFFSGFLIHSCNFNFMRETTNLAS